MNSNTLKNSDIYRNIAKVDYIKSLENSRNVTDFLNFQKNDLSKATGQPTGSIRYDERMPAELKQRIQEIANIINLVAEYFEGDLDKTKMWFSVENPLLGGLSPRDMIRFGRYQKLYKFILNSRAGNAP